VFIGFSRFLHLSVPMLQLGDRWAVFNEIWYWWNLLNFYLHVPVLVKLGQFTRAHASHCCTQLECNSLNMYQTEECFERTLFRGHEDTFYIQYTFSAWLMTFETTKLKAANAPELLHCDFLFSFLLYFGV
jgi:hypothetical protein